MKLRYLAMRGIGPFGGECTIDFDAVSVNGLFLLEGPTGSGKSTIIDAITWALYGTVAGGSESTADRMRSSHADPEAESYVDLWITLSSGTYRVRRTPQWQREGRKSAIAATAKLWKLPDDAIESGCLEAGEVLCTKVADTTIEIGSLIGLQADQFVQTIVLPQGKFAQFLKLSSDDRTDLLERIFDTSLYRRFSETLHDLASDARRSVDDSRLALTTALSTAATIAELPHEVIQVIEDTARNATSPSDIAPVIKQLTDAVTTHGRESERADAEAEHHEKHRIAAHEHLAAVTALHHAIERRAELIAQQTELNARTHAIEEAERTLRNHGAAARIQPFLTAAEHAEHELTRAEQFAREATGIDPHDISDTDARAAHARADELLRESGAINELVQRAAELDIAQAAQCADQDELQRIRNELEAAKAAIDVASRSHEAVQEQLALAEQAASRIQQTQSARDTAEALVTRVAEREDLHSRIATLDESIARAIADAQHAEEHRHRVASSWFASAAARLATELRSGHACPVCGSTIHPAPAQPGESLTTQEQVTAAEKAATSARRHLDELQRTRAELSGRESALLAETNSITMEAANEQLAAAEKTCQEAQAATLTVSELRATLQRLDDESHKRMRAIDSLTTSETQLCAALDHRSATISEGQAYIARRLGKATSVEALQESHAAALAEQQERVTAIDSLITAQQAAQRATAALRHALGGTPFTAAQEAHDALLPETRAAELQASIADHHTALHDVARELAQPDIAALSGDEIADVTAAQEAEDAALAAAQAAATAAIRARQRATQSRAALEQCHKRLGEFAATYQQAASAIRLSELVNAGAASLTHIPLTTYVLQKRFERVVARANEHLERISLGRYSLKRTDEKEKGSRKARTGLGLVVVDHLGNKSGDTERSTRTLSGGESFYTALSLALGLADVVRSENGGIALDTLIIDEGFGSLDDTTLDQVLSVLTGLTVHGRTVAIVSHVEELKKMIPERVIVTPQADGSSALSTTSPGRALI